ncbi:MAG: hypothetical protein RRZ24_03570 [Clostridia bacterium]
MALKKCPKCELNYIRADEEYCNVCLREMRRVVARDKREDEEEETLICSECGEAPAVRGGELCAECLKEQKRQAELENAAEIDPDLVELTADVEEEEEDQEA